MINGFCALKSTYCFSKAAPSTNRIVCNVVFIAVKPGVFRCYGIVNAHPIINLLNFVCVFALGENTVARTIKKQQFCDLARILILNRTYNFQFIHSLRTNEFRTDSYVTKGCVCARTGRLRQHPPIDSTQHATQTPKISLFHLISI